jgi:hypothetical protein
MPFPQTADELKARGYKFLDDATCNRCGDSIEWWETPNDKKMPFDPMKKGSDKAIKHFDTCTG